MKLSARNVLKGRVVEVKKGATISNDAVEELKLAVGDTAYAVVKASDVMVAKD
jgi:molybdopterin-binding protein